MNNNTYIFGQRKAEAEEYVLSQERLKQLREQQKRFATSSCKFCGAETNDFQILNPATCRYSCIDLAINRQGMLRTRIHPSPDWDEHLQEILQIQYCPMCGRRFS